MTTGIEVTDEVFESGRASCSTRPRTGCTRSRPCWSPRSGADEAERSSIVKVVVALGGNALLKRGEPMTADAQRANIRVAAESLAPVAGEHQLVISHGNGPQVGLLALAGRRLHRGRGLSASTSSARRREGMIGYLIEQELGNLLPAEVPLATILTMVEVDPDDPAFDDPTKFVGPVYDEGRGRCACGREGLDVQGATASTGVASSRPRSRSGSSRSARSAGCSSSGVVVICAGGGGIPTMYAAGEDRTPRRRRGRDRQGPRQRAAGAELDADLFVMATDVDGVYVDWGTPSQRRLDRVTTDELRAISFPAGSMGPKVDAAAEFVEATGQARRDRIARRHRKRSWQEPPARTSCRASRRSDRTMSEPRCPLRGRQAAQGDGPPART